MIGEKASTPISQFFVLYTHSIASIKYALSLSLRNAILFLKIVLYIPGKAAKLRDPRDIVLYFIIFSSPIDYFK